ncbi:hypothetical protein [Qipengyuania sp. Mu-71]|uniref:hypothetical protein n=1 Tax=Qipengyuania sp. Mu-71 TaxID=3121477 RepID=UPI002FE45EB5
MAENPSRSARLATDPFADTIITIEAAGTASLPRRIGGRAVDRIVQLTQLLADLVHPDHAIDKLAFRKSLERRAANSVSCALRDRRSG